MNYGLDDGRPASGSSRCLVGKAVTCEPVVAIFITFAAVSCEVIALEVLKVCLLKALLVACQCAQHTGPSLLDHQIPAFAAQMHIQQSNPGKTEDIWQPISLL